MLLEHPAVVECAVTGIPDEARGQVIKATVVLTKDQAETGEDFKRELQEHVKEMTAAYKYPRVIEFVSELPKTVSGKILRRHPAPARPQRRSTSTSRRRRWREKRREKKAGDGTK